MRLYRRAYHSGSWYSNDKEELRTSIDRVFKKINIPQKFIKAVISPHAGYAYSLETISHVYASINIDNIKNVFILGPNHHIYNKGCLLPKVRKYETPFGFLEINKKIVDDLILSAPDDLYNYIDSLDDEEEHSIEMQLPLLKYIINDKKIKIIPIYVGCIGNNVESIEQFSKPLEKYFEDNSNLFIFSSDFCHYGPRFNFTTILKKYNDTHIFKQIENMDMDAADIISKHDVEGFIDYLLKTHNTICGSNPIKILLTLLQQYSGKIFTKLIHYSQSNPARNCRDSSVSYAGIISSIN